MNDKRRITHPLVLPDRGGYEEYTRIMRAYREALVDKWQWLLEGDEKKGVTPIDKKLWVNMAMLFENQQALARERPLLEGPTTTSDIALPDAFAFPIIRQVYPALFANRIASIQPLSATSGGTGKLFYLDFKENASGKSLTELDSSRTLTAENAVPKQIKMTLVSDTVEAEKYMLGAVWKTEVQEDARAVGLDVQRELVSAMSDEIQRELDMIMLNEILAGATAGSVTWHWTVGAGYTAQEWYQTLAHALVDMEAYIFQKRYRNADYIVCGTAVGGYLQKSNSFKYEGRTAGIPAGRMGVEYVGRIDNRWDVYITTLINQYRGFMGFYPTSQVDTGYIYAPYVPLQLTPLVYAEYDETTGVYKHVDAYTQSVRTRAGKKMAVGNCYADLTIAA